MPELTIRMNRPDPFNPNDGCGHGRVDVRADGLVDKIHDLWNRNPVTVSRRYTASYGRQDAPVRPNRPGY
jgi:hypothetical protein